MIQINPREIAAEAMVQIMAEGAYNNGALRRLLRQNGAMSRQDRAFVTEVVNGTLRNLYYLDYILNTFSKVRTEKMKPWILAVLRTALYQMYFMNTPDAAACNEAVKLTGERGYAKLGGFVNGVLRTAGRRKEEIALPEKGTAEYLSVCFSHPLWLVKMWIAYYGFEFTKELCRANNMAPDVTVRVNTLKTDKAKLRKALEERGVQVRDGKMENALHLSATADLGRMDLFREGWFHVQDESSQAAAALLAPRKGERVLDVCAAPGGKSFTMAQEMENAGEIIARDIYAHKIELIEQGAGRLGIRNLRTEEKDAALWEREDAEAFDRVLVDAPCSGLGLLRKKPDIRLKKDGQEIDQLIPIQRRILDCAAGYVKPGGVLVYSTCTLSRKENEKNVQWFLEKHPEFSPDAAAPFLPEEMIVEKDSCMVTLFPHLQGTDGFFMARLVKKGS